MGKDVSNEQLFELMTKMYNELTGRMDSMHSELTGRMDSMHSELTGRIDSMQGEMQGMQDEIKEIKNRVIVIEQEHGKKLDALFDGYKQNSDKLDRIEEEVSKHEEIILRRIK